jgi:hypothetical protein
LQVLFSSYDVAVGHLRRYDRRSLAREFEGLGLRIEKMSYWGAVLVPLLLLRKVVLAKGQRSEAEIIRAGLEPPGRLTHAGLRTLMKLETSLGVAPPFGTSLMLRGRRTE